jgi:hypothetical protein
VEELRQKDILLMLAGNALNAILEGLGQTDEETRDRIMRMCGEACAREEHFGPATEIAESISREEKYLDRIIERANGEISWCGRWMRSDDLISSTCRECGCPLVRHGVVRNTGVFCHCSKGWVETILGILLKRPVMVELEKALGLGDDECRYVVHLGKVDRP